MPEHLTIGLLRSRARRKGGMGLRRGAEWAMGHITVSARTGPDGSFELDCPTDGWIRIVVKKPGHALGGPPAAWLDKPIAKLPITLKRSIDAPRVQLIGAVPIGRAGSILEFHEDGDQRSYSLAIDINGKCSTEWLRPGGRYRIGTRTGGAFIVWGGQKSITLTPGGVPPPKDFLVPLRPPDLRRAIRR